MTIQSRRCGLERRERQARDKAVSDAKKIQKTAPEHRWGGRTIFARVVREGKAMIHSSRRDRKAKAIAEVLAMIANAQAPLAPHRPRPVLEADERLFETAAEFCAALEKYASDRRQRVAMVDREAGPRQLGEAQRYADELFEQYDALFDKGFSAFVCPTVTTTYRLAR